MKKTNRIKNHVRFNLEEEKSKKKRMTRRRNKNEKDAKNRTINASLRIKNRTLTPMMPTTSITTAGADKNNE
jgi:hypothetical protein